MPDELKDIGAKLKKARLESKLTLEDIFEETKVSITYLTAIEEADIGAFPSRVYYNMFARSYARELGFDVDDLFGIEPPPQTDENTEDIAEAIPAATPNGKAKSNSHEPSFLKIGIWLAAIVAAVFIIILIALSSGDDEQESPPEKVYGSSVIESAVDNKTELSGTIDTASLVIPETEPESTDPVLPLLPPMRLNIQVFDSCWIYVKADGDTVLNRNLVSGNSRSLTAYDNFIISIGNPDGIMLKINDTLLRSLSRRGRPVMEREINRDNKSDFYYQPEDSIVVTP